MTTRTSSPILRLQIVTSERDTFVEQVLDTGGSGIVTARVSTEDPARIDLPEGTEFSSVDATDVLEHVVDEEAWLDAIAMAMSPGSSLVVRVPFEGPVAWLDARNVYRYMQDITGWGQRLKETQTKGWHRHYTRRDLERLLHGAGFAIDRIETHGSPAHDVVQLGHLVWGKVVRGNEMAEFAALERRADADAGLDLPKLGPFSTKIAAWATKP